MEESGKAFVVDDWVSVQSIFGLPVVICGLTCYTVVAGSALA